jgi:large subunit ribosomal protein L13
MTSFVPRKGDIQRDWWLVDATDKTLGRLSTEIASRLRGKHKPYFTPFLDTGDHVVVINADKVALSGNKIATKMYRKHSGYPGGLREVNAETMLAKHPERLIEKSVKGMLPKGPLGRQMYRKLKVYAGEKHPHAAQQPKPLDIPGADRTR